MTELVSVPEKNIIDIDKVRASAEIQVALLEHARSAGLVAADEIRSGLVDFKLTSKDIIVSLRGENTKGINNGREAWVGNAYGRIFPDGSNGFVRLRPDGYEVGLVNHDDTSTLLDLKPDELKELVAYWISDNAVKEAA